MLLQRIYNLVNRKDLLSSRIYDYFMLLMIITSVVPLMFVDDYPIFRIIEIVTVLVFIIDYLLRWITSGHAAQKRLAVVYHLSLYANGHYRLAVDSAGIEFD